MDLHRTHGQKDRKKRLPNIGRTMLISVTNVHLSKFNTYINNTYTCKERVHFQPDAMLWFRYAFHAAPTQFPLVGDNKAPKISEFSVAQFQTFCASVPNGKIAGFGNKLLDFNTETRAHTTSNKTTRLSCPQIWKEDSDPTFQTRVQEGVKFTTT